MSTRMSERPKRPMTAYFLWFCSNRPQIKADHPGWSAIQIAKKAGELWRNIVDKKEWEEKAQKLMAQYRKQLSDYKAQRSEGSSCARKRRRLSRPRSWSSSDDDSY